MKHYAFALACFVLAAGILRAGLDIDEALPSVVDYRSGPMFSPPTIEHSHAKATAYCACEYCCGQWADGITFSGSVATQGRTIAADPSLYPMGTCLDLSGLGKRIVEDIGGAIQGRRIDVFFDTHDAALEYGVQWVRVRGC